jgi:hypothetical protein
MNWKNMICCIVAIFVSGSLLASKRARDGDDQEQDRKQSSVVVQDFSRHFKNMNIKEINELYLFIHRKEGYTGYQKDFEISDFRKISDFSDAPSRGGTLQKLALIVMPNESHQVFQNLGTFWNENRLTKLQELSIIGEAFSNEQLGPLIGGLNDLSSLTILRLCFDSTQYKDGWRELCQALKENISLRELILDDMHRYNHPVIYDDLFSSLPQNLTGLTLSNWEGDPKEMTPEEAGVISKCLSTNTKLISFAVCNPKVKSKAALILLQSMHLNATLQEFDLSDNCLKDWEDIASLLRGMTRNTTLLTLDLTENVFQDQDDWSSQYPDGTPVQDKIRQVQILLQKAKSTDS